VEWQGLMGPPLVKVTEKHLCKGGVCLEGPLSDLQFCHLPNDLPPPGSLLQWADEAPRSRENKAGRPRSSQGRGDWPWPHQAAPSTGPLEIRPRWGEKGGLRQGAGLLVQLVKGFVILMV
jgi:hypothetical protein